MGENNVVLLNGKKETQKQGLFAIFLYIQQMLVLTWTMKSLINNGTPLIG